MKKILSVLVTCFLMMFLMGFTQNQADLFSEVQKVSKWNAVEAKGRMTIQLPYSEDKKESLAMDFTSLTDNKNLKSQITLSNIKFPSNRNYPPLKMYYDKNTFYYDMNSAVVMASEFLEEDAGKYVEVKDSYLGYTVDVEKMLSNPFYEDVYAYHSLLKITNNPQMLLENLDRFYSSNATIDLEVKKEGSKFSIDGDLYQFGKVGKIFLKEMKLASDKEIESFEASLEATKDQLEQIRINYSVEFSGDSYKGEIRVNPMGEFNLYHSFAFDMSFASVKKDSLSIEMPKSYIKFNLNEIMAKIDQEVPTYSPEEETLYEDPAPFLTIKLDGSYVMEGGVKGKLSYQNIYGNMYILRSELEKILDTSLESSQEYVHIGSIDETDKYYYNWNSEGKSIEVFQY